MQFLADNYLWFIIGGIIILMAVIGYFADKTDFGRKKLEEPEEKKEKKEKQKKQKEEKIKEEKKKPTKIEAKGLADLSQSITEKAQEEISFNADETLKPSENVSEDLYAPIGDDVLATPEEPVSEDLYAPLPEVTEVSEPVVEEAIANEPVLEETVTEDLNEEEPVNIDVEQAIEESTLNEVSEDVVPEELQSVDLDTLPEVGEDVSQVVSEDDDIWKF